MNEKTLSGKKAVMIIASKDFQDEEYLVTKDILERANVKVKTASNRIGAAVGSFGGETTVDILVKDINPTDFSAVVFIGGGGCLDYLDNENSYKVCRETISRNKILASICISPMILAKAGVLKGKKATVWSSPLDKYPIKTLEENGAIYEAESVVQDGKIITANGPSAAEEFGQTILEALMRK